MIKLLQTAKLAKRIDEKFIVIDPENLFEVSMKKLLVTALAILASGAAYALPVGNPSEASLLCDGLVIEGNCCKEFDLCDPCASLCDAFSFRFGFYGDYVFNRHLTLDDSDGCSSDDGMDFDIEHTRLSTNAGYIAFNIWNRFDIFSSLGQTKIDFDTNASEYLTGTTHNKFLVGPRLEVETNTKFSWSVGARATVWECGCTALGVEGQYFQTRPDIKRITLGGLNSTYPPSDSGDSSDCDNLYSPKYHEWQVGFGISHRIINILVPYVAAKWSKVHWNFRDENFIFAGNSLEITPIRNDKRWGFAVGCSLVDCEKMAVTVEGRFCDEKALYVNGQVRF